MALARRIGFTLFDRWGNNMGRLQYESATHTEALDGTDELKIRCSREIAKGQRLRIDIASADAAHYVRHTNCKGLFSAQTTARIAHNTIDLAQSSLTLPIESHRTFR